MGRKGAKGEGASPLHRAPAPPLSAGLAATRALPPHPLPAPRPLVRPPTLPPSGACGTGAAAERRPWEAAVGVCVRVKDAASRSAFAGAGGSGGAVGSGSGGDGGGGFRSPAAKMLKVTVPSCSGSTASVDRAAGNLVPDYWIDGSKRDALSDFFEVESELGR